MADYDDRGAYTPPSDRLAFDSRTPVRGGGPAPVTLIVSGVVLVGLVGGVFFLDSGSAFSERPEMVTTVGVGLRVLFPQFNVFPFRIDFGYVRVGSQKRRRLRLRNTGTGSLQVAVGNLAAPFTAVPQIGNADPGCFTIPPGRQRTVDLFLTGLVPTKGKRKVNLHLVTSDPARPQVDVPVTGGVLSPLTPSARPQRRVSRPLPRPLPLRERGD